MIDQHVDRGVVEVSRGATVALNADQFVDLADTDSPCRQGLTNLRKVATDPRPTHLRPGDLRRLVTRRPQISLHRLVAIESRCLASLRSSTRRQPTSIQLPRFELELFDLGMQRSGRPCHVLAEHLPEHASDSIRTYVRLQLQISIVFQRNRVRCDVHLRFVFGDFDYTAFAHELGAQLRATRLTRAVETLFDIGTAPRTRDETGVGHAAAPFLSIEPGNAPVCSP